MLITDVGNSICIKLSCAVHMCAQIESKGIAIRSKLYPTLPANRTRLPPLRLQLRLWLLEMNFPGE